MSLKSCFALRFTLNIMDKLVQKISTSITVLYGPFSAHEVFNIADGGAPFLNGQNIIVDGGATIKLSTE